MDRDVDTAVRAGRGTMQIIEQIRELWRRGRAPRRDPAGGRASPPPLPSRASWYDPWGASRVAVALVAAGDARRRRPRQADDGPWARPAARPAAREEVSR